MVRSVCAAASVAWKPSPAVRRWRPGPADNGSPAATARAVAVADAARDGRPDCAGGFRRSGEALGLAIAGAVTLLDLDLVVIGGGVARGRRRCCSNRSRPPTPVTPPWVSRRAPRVVPALLAAAAGLIGAAAVVLRPDAYWPGCGCDASVRLADPGGDAFWTGCRRSSARRGPVAGGRMPAWSRSACAGVRAGRASCCAGSSGTRRWSRPGRWQQAVGGPVTSSARTCSAPDPSRSAAPTCGSPGCPSAEKAAGVVAASAGNHAQGVALAASLVGIDGDGLHAGRRVHRQADRHPRLRRRRRTGGRDRWTSAGGRTGLRRPDRRRAGAPVRPSGRAARPGHRRAGDPRAGARRGHRGGRGRRRRADQRGRRGAQGAAAGRADRRGAGRTGRRLAGFAARPAARSGCGEMSTLADGIAVGRAVRADLRARQPSWSTRSSRSRRTSCPRPCCCCLERAKLVVEPAGVAAVAAIMARPGAVHPAGGGGAVRRQHRPAGAAARHPARPGGRRGGSCRCASRSSTGRVRWPRCWPWSASSAATWWTSSTPGSVRRCRWVTSRSRCGWRPAVPSTATRSCEALTAPDSGSSSGAERCRAPTAASDRRARGRRSRLRRISRRRAWPPARLTFCTRPFGRMYSRDSPRLAPRMA